MRRKSLRSEIKTISKRIHESVARKDLEQAQSLLTKAFSKLDKSRKSRVYHPNTANRLKSKLAREINTILEKASAQVESASAG